MSGTAGSESDGYDANGSENRTTISGGTFQEIYDDEDRMTSITTPGGITDTFTYNGLGLRVSKTDSTGSYAYICDGTTPGSPVLSDGHTLYTPGLSENTGGASRYYANDLLGNLWTIDGSSKGQLDYQDTTGFGSLIAQSGAGSVFGFGGGNGCQSDADTGLVLMGHRYYDARIGRFISQDPAGDGDNWYEYAGNDPVDEVDPEGLTPTVNIEGWSPVGTPGYADGAASGSAGAFNYYNNSQGHWTRGEPTGINIYGHLSNEGGEVDTDWVPDMTGPMIAAGGPDRDPIDPDRGHGPQGTGKSKYGIHTDPRAGDKGNQNFGKRGYPKDPPSKREIARRLEQEAQKQAKDAARAEKDAVLRGEQRAAAAETADAVEDLAIIEDIVTVDEAVIAIGVILK